MLKRCTKCAQDKPLDAFPKGRNRCKDCGRTYHTLYNRGYRVRNRPKHLAQRKTWRQANAAKENARSAAWRVANPEKSRASSHAYMDANKAKIAAKAKETRKANPERNRLQKQRYRAKNTEKVRLQQQAYRHAHPEKFLAYSRNPQKREDTRAYRAKKRGAPLHDLTHAQWVEIQETQQHRCYYCGKRCKGKLTQDHIIPVSKGGSHTLHNVIGACRSCNARKRDRTAPIPVQPLLLTIAPAKKKKAS